MLFISSFDQKQRCLPQKVLFLFSHAVVSVIRHYDQSGVVIGTIVFQCLNIICCQCNGSFHALTVRSLFHTDNIGVLVIDKRCVGPVQMDELETVSRLIHHNTLGCQILLESRIIRSKRLGIRTFRMRFP